MFNEVGKFAFDSVWPLAVFAYILLPALLLYKGSVVGISLEGLGKTNTEAMKGVAILFIVVHHLTQGTVDPGIMGPFFCLGYFGVALFFFFSGYGLSVSGLRRGDYCTGFFSRRLGRVWAPYVLVNFFAVCIAIIIYGENYSGLDMVCYLLGIKLIDGVNWFVDAITFFYLIFYACFRCFSARRAIQTLFICSIFYAGILHAFHFGVYWINSALAFPMGVWIAHDKEKLISFVERNNTIILLSGFLFTGIFYLLGFYPNEVGLHVKNIIGLAQILAMGISTLFFTVVLCNLRLNSKVMIFIGGISYELYLMHIKVRYVYFDTWHGTDFFGYFMLVIISAFFLKQITRFMRKVFG